MLRAVYPNKLGHYSTLPHVTAASCNRNLGDMIRLVIFPPFLTRKTTFCDFLSALNVKTLLGSTLKRKEFAPTETKFFPFSVDLFPEGKQNHFNKVASLETVSFPLKCIIYIPILSGCIIAVKDRPDMVTWESLFTPPIMTLLPLNVTPWRPSVCPKLITCHTTCSPLQTSKPSRLP